MDGDSGLGVADLRANGFEGAVEVGLDGVDRHLGDCRDLSEIHLFGEAHEEDGTLVGGEVFEGSDDLGGLFLDEDAGLGGGLVAGEKVGGVGDVDGGGAGLTPEAEFLQALLIADEIDGDAGEPGVDGAVPAEVGAAVVGLEETVLSNGLSEIGVADGEGDKAEQARPVCPNQGVDVVQLRRGTFGSLNIRHRGVKYELHTFEDVRLLHTDYTQGGVLG